MVQIFSGLLPGAQLGQAVGSSLRDTLGQLAQQKATSLQQQGLQQAYANLGLPGQLALLPESVQKGVADQFIREQALNKFNTLLGGGAPSSSTGMAALTNLPSFMELMKSGADVPRVDNQVPVSMQSSSSSLQPGMPTVQPQVASSVAQEGGLKEFGGATAEQVRAAMQVLPPQLQQQLEQRLQHAERLAFEKQKYNQKITAEERKLAAQEDKLAQAETKQYAATILDHEKAAKENDIRLNRMEKLINAGKLPNAGLWNFLSKVEDVGSIPLGALGGIAGTAIAPGVGTLAGLGIGTALGGIAGSLVSPLAGAVKSLVRATSPDIEEFEKLSSDFVRNAKQFFGNRLTDADLKAYMATIPNLMQTDAGKKRVIENLKSINSLAKKEAQAYRDILRAHQGKRPRDIEQQVQDRIKDDVELVIQDFIGR